MHYPLDAFAVGAKPTISLLKPYSGTVGQRAALSPGDIAAIKKMYSL
jgi:hypothetical protein